jgi:hypothetical protein
VRGDEEPAIELPDTERVYARVLERISGDPTGYGLAAARRAVGHAARQASLAAGLLVAVCSGMLTTGAIWFVRVAPTYETAAAGAPSVDAGGPNLEVVFRDDASADQIRSGLREIGATVISGPTQMGVYRLRLAPGADVNAAVSRLRGEGRGVAAFAEPSRI